MKTAICIASGPSLTEEDVNYCKGKGKIYAIKENYIAAPWADVLYAADTDWWDMYYDRIGAGEMPEFKGEKWTVSNQAYMRHGVNYVKDRRTPPCYWSDDISRGIATGGNSGFQAINLAVLQGAERVILLGYDYGYDPATQDKHWWEEKHPRESRYSNYANWIKYLVKAAPLIPVPVLNASRQSAIPCFEKVNLKDVI